jgi:hypothetical protein
MLDILRIDEKNYTHNVNVLNDKFLNCEMHENYEILQELNAARVTLYTCQYKISQLEKREPMLGYEISDEEKKTRDQNP